MPTVGLWCDPYDAYEVEGDPANGGAKCEKDEGEGALRKSEPKKFTIRRGLDQDEKPAVEVEIERDGGGTKRRVIPLDPDFDKKLREVEKEIEGD